MADHIAHPERHVPDKRSHLGAYLSSVASWLVAGLFMLSVFAAVVPTAAWMHQQEIKRQAQQKAIEDARAKGTAPGTSKTPAPVLPRANPPASQPASAAPAASGAPPPAQPAKPQ